MRYILAVSTLLVPLFAHAAGADDLYVKKATFPETVAATRAAFVAAETAGEIRPTEVRFGPWYTTGWMKSDGFADALFPEKGVDLEAKKENGEPKWTLRADLADGAVHMFSGGDGGPTYLFRTIESKNAEAVPVGFGSDDGLAVFLNGERILANDVPRGPALNQDRATLQLKPGRNELLLKIYNRTGGHGFAFSSNPVLDQRVLDAWRRIETDFPAQTAWLRRFVDLQASNWFSAGRGNEIEKGLLASLLGQLGEKGSSLKGAYDQLVAQDVSPDDARWLVLFEKIASLVTAQERLAPVRFDSLRLAVEDLNKTFGDRYPGGPKYLERIAELENRMAAIREAVAGGDPAAHEKLGGFLADYESLRSDALLSNPLMAFDTLLFRRARNAGLLNNWVSSCSRGKGGYGNEIAALSPPRPGGTAETFIQPKTDTFLGDMCLHWNADRMLVTSLGTDNEWHVFEVDMATREMTQITPDMGEHVDNAEAIYAPDGAVIFSSTATMLGVPCVGGTNDVANLYRLEPDRKTVRQITFEQDQDWCPTILNNGRVMYLRWEYTDTPHYFTRVMFSMNPDGTRQMEHYGSNSFWPNSLFFAKACPNHPTKFVGIVSGHHGVARIGELCVFDPAKGRQEDAGAVQRIPGHGKEVEGPIVDQLVDSSWPKFLHPWPLSDKYFLVSMQPTPQSNWGIYLVDVFDNMLLLHEEPTYGLYEPLSLAPRPTPPAIPSQVDLTKKEATVYLTDVYMGDGLRGVPRGHVKSLRLFTYSFGYRLIGGHHMVGMESSWDCKRILGEVPVQEDGSAIFEIPANMPVAIQPLDKDGAALQLMRSWFVGQPGERVSCVGCHEKQNTTPPSRLTLAGQSKPMKLETPYGEPRMIGFKHEIQPILDQYCVGCHDGQEEGRPNFANTAQGPSGFSYSYHALHGYARRPGPESDYHMFRPMEYHSSTSELMQMFDKGHHNVQLDSKSRYLLNLWIDMNVPYFATWTEIAEAGGVGNSLNAPIEHIAAKYSENLERFAGVKYCPEADAKRPLPPKPEFVKPEELPEPDYSAPAVPGWPFPAEVARQMQQDEPKTVELNDGVTMTLVPVPAGSFVMGDAGGDRDELPRSAVAIAKPFWMMTTEVTNAMYAEFDPSHDSRYIDQQSKDHTRPGYVANAPNQPVIRITWKQANDFCRWLSAKTGRICRLPTEAEWEWACRAGSDAPMWWGQTGDDFTAKADLADESLKLFVVAGVDPQPIHNPPDWLAFIPMAKGFNDGRMYAGDVAHYEANPWGLHDMHGSVAEWTASDYRPYPYIAADGREAGNPTTAKVVRGGSWRDRPHRARSGFRLRYQPWQPVFNVGFRVVMEE